MKRMRVRNKQRPLLAPTVSFNCATYVVLPSAVISIGDVVAFAHKTGCRILAIATEEYSQNTVGFCGGQMQLCTFDPG